jgi:hypothetical protein
MFTSIRRKKESSTTESTAATATTGTVSLPSSSTTTTVLVPNVLDAALSRLHTLGINFVALDFDCTILDIHTGGRWPGTLDELQDHIRPEFRQFMRAAVHSRIYLAVVTFSVQVDLVRGIVQTILGDKALASRVPIRGADRSWSYQGQGSRKGKQAYMASAVEELQHQSDDVVITKKTSLLIDDDRSNIRHALQDGVRALWFNPDKPHHLLRDMGRLE